MKKIIVTGVTGFVGENLKEYLKNSYQIVGVSRTAQNNCIAYTKVDKEIDNTYALVHLAGKAHDVKKVVDPDAYTKINTELTQEIFDQFLESTCKVFIYMSSVKACADTVTGVLDESTSPNPITAYGKSKLEAEQYILSKKIPNNKRVYILRPCMIHGPNNKGNLNLLYNVVSKGVPYPLAAYQNQRSFVSVQNVCFVIKELLENKSVLNGVYHLADDTALSTNDLVRYIASVTNKTGGMLKLPKTLVRAIALVGDVLPLPLNSDRLQKLTENYVVSNKKIKEAIQKDLPLSAKEGIINTIKSFV